MFEISTAVIIKDPQARILSKQNWGDYFLLAIRSPQVAAQAEPGRFIMVRVSSDSSPLLRRPFSIHSRGKDTIEIFFQKLGAGTRLLAERKAGSTLDIIGPLGKGFSIDPGLRGKSIIAVGGGRGIAPLFFLSQKLASLGAEVTVLFGGKSLQDLCLREKFERNGIVLSCSTEDGTYGFTGLVTELLTSSLKLSRPEKLYSCGPEAMMEEISRIAAREKIPAELSIESIMGCGFGACWGCVRKIRKEGEVQWVKICEQGPVFPAEEIVW